VRLALRFITMLLLFALLCASPRAGAQGSDSLMPDESAVKAKRILQQAIDALGGQAYLRVRESECTGRIAQFEHNGQLSGYLDFLDLWKFPDRNRTEYMVKSHKALDIYQGDFTKRGKIVDVFAGDQGWTLDKGGVQDEPAAVLADFQEQVKTSFDNLLRFRLKEEGLIYRYNGGDLVDLKLVDWIEIVDRDRRTFQIAVDRESHFPIRMVVIKRNDVTRERTEEVFYFSDYHLVGGVRTPLQIARDVDGRRNYQVFYTTCTYDPGLPDEIYTKASLEKRYAAVGKKNNKDKDKREKGDKDEKADKGDPKN
jgi:hypothetical protein